MRLRYVRSRLDYSLVWQGTGQIDSAHPDSDKKMVGLRHCAPVALAIIACYEKSSWQLVLAFERVKLGSELDTCSVNH